MLYYNAMWHKLTYVLLVGVNVPVVYSFLSVIAHVWTVKRAPLDVNMCSQCLIWSGLNENGYRFTCLNTWSPAGGVIGKELEV